MEKDLKTKMENIKGIAVKELGDTADTLLVSFDEGQCSCIMHGESQNIAHAIFALIHNSQNQTSMDLYRIVKLIVLNIVNNESPYAMDLLQSILNVPAPVEQNDKHEKNKAILIQMPSKNGKE